MIIDCFPFFDELDLLEVRLNELKDVVDVFVLTESPRTFTGEPKPLYFQENKNRFAEFNIIATIYQDTVDIKPMERERRQKQYNLDVAFGDLYKPGDVIIQGDCDEIPNAGIVKEALDKDWASARLSMKLFYFFMNCMDVGQQRLYKNSRLLRPKNRIVYDAGQKDKTDKVYWDAGWHFSYLGNVQKKLAAWGHAPKYNKPPYNTTEHIEHCRRTGSDLFGRKSKRFQFVDDLSYLPGYVLDNMETFDKYVYKNNHILH